MDGERCSPFPHYSWLAHWIAVPSPRVFDVHVRRQVGHSLLLTTSGDAQIVWATPESELTFHPTVGSIGFFPHDRQLHTWSITTANGFAAYNVIIPDQPNSLASTSKGLGFGGIVRPVPVFRDDLMEASLLRLSSRIDGRQISEDIGDEIAARQIVVRLCALIGSRPPAWQKDTSVFTPRVMRRIVACIDAHLVVPMSLACIADTVGLSPGHFARKFRHSAGESLERFMNRRRIGTSFSMLRGDSPPLTQIALDLGFSSQSHFTRLFTGFTGMTPRQFWRLHHRVIG